MLVKQCDCLGVMYPYCRFCIYCGKMILYKEIIDYEDIENMWDNTACI